MKHFTLISILLLLGLSSCFKKEKPITLPGGNSEITSLFLGQGYIKDMYFDLGTNTYQERTWADWDLRFEATPNGYGVFINTAKNMSVRKIDLHHLTETGSLDTLKIKEKPELIEPPEGKVEESAMKDWKTYKVGGGAATGIYVLELKYNQGYQRFKRLQIQAVDDSAFYVRVTDLYDKDNHPIETGETIEIPKNRKQNFTYYTFANGGRIVENAEPDKNSWDFVFTRYAHIFYNVLPGNAPFPYIVSGVLNNANKVEVARDSAGANFEDIDANSVDKYKFSTNSNAIGYDWKAHAMGPGGAYSIVPRVTYIIKDTEGHYYKLRFLDYNNELGQPGYPKFEFIRIK